MVLPDGEARGRTSCRSIGHAIEFLKDQYRHCKPILALGASSHCSRPREFGHAPRRRERPRVLVCEEGNVKKAVAAFVDAIAKHRHFERETDPPRV